MTTRKHTDPGPGESDRTMQDRIAQLEASQARLLRAQELSQLQRDLAVTLCATPDLDTGLRLCLDVACRAGGMDSGGIYLLNPQTGALELTCHEGLTEPFVDLISYLDAETPQAGLVRRGQPVYTRHRDIDIPVVEAEFQEGLSALAVLPVRHEGRVIGCLNVASHSLAEIPAQARPALEAIAAQVGSAIARLQAQQGIAALSRKLISAREDERRRLAAEIHDSVGQRLIAIQLAARAALEQCPHAHAAGPRQHVKRIAHQCVDLVQEVRRISQGLYPATLEALGLAAALQHLVGSVHTDASLVLDLAEDLHERRFAGDVEIALFRIAQEALSNALRHSQATEIRLSLQHDHGQIVLCVRDDGVGFARRDRAETGMGLVAMRERAQAVGAVLEIASAAGGTSVCVRVTA